MCVCVFSAIVCTCGCVRMIVLAFNYRYNAPDAERQGCLSLSLHHRHYQQFCGTRKEIKKPRQSGHTTIFASPFCCCCCCSYKLLQNCCGFNLCSSHCHCRCRCRRDSSSLFSFLAYSLTVAFTFIHSVFLCLTSILNNSLLASRILLYCIIQFKLIFCCCRFLFL